MSRIDDIIVHVFNKSGMFHDATYKSYTISHTRDVVPQYKVGEFYPISLEIIKGSECTTMIFSDKIEKIKCSHDHHEIKLECYDYEHCPYCGCHL